MSVVLIFFAFLPVGVSKPQWQVSQLCELVDVSASIGAFTLLDLSNLPYVLSPCYRSSPSKNSAKLGLQGYLAIDDLHKGATRL
jgi:hypothetical protein